MFEGVRVALLTVNQLKPIKLDDFDKTSLEILFKLRNLSVDRLNPFLGLVFNESHSFIVVWKFEARCSLRDVVFNEDFNMNDQFVASFLSDIAKVCQCKL